MGNPEYINRIIEITPTVCRLARLRLELEMIMDFAAFEELLVSALETPAKKTLDSLLAILATAGNPLPEKVVESLALLWEKWSNDDLDVAQGEFCIGVAALPGTDNSTIFRKLLPGATRTVLPPYLTRNPIMKALGVRDEEVSLADFSTRLRKLLGIKSGTVVFLPHAERWGVLGAIDSINATASVGPFANVGVSAAVPLEIILRDAVIFTSAPELNRLVSVTRPPLAADFRSIVAKRALNVPDEDVMKLMARTGCARLLREQSAFDKYWNAVGAVAAAGNVRRASNGRSLKEVDMLLASEAPDALNDADVTAFTAFFTNLKKETAFREFKLLGSCIAGATARSTAEQQKVMFAALPGKAPFWPVEPLKGPLALLEAWGELPAKSLEQLAVATKAVFSEEYLAQSAMRLPLKALNGVMPNVDDDLLYETYCSYKQCSADLLLWIWKNRKKHNNEELLRLVNVDNVSRALQQENLPKAWGNAMRDLRSAFMDDEKFQLQLIDAANGDAAAFAAALQGMHALTSGERQSLMVKLSRVSAELREYLESGAGQRILRAGSGASETKAPVVDEPNYTSVRSHERLSEELNHLINVLVPENREALKFARSLGDFRENSEFDAAKERRNFLSRRRAELERDLAKSQPITMASIKVEDVAVVGSEIELTCEDGSKEVYQLLGAWDGDPERNFLAYSTRFGRAVLNQKLGSSFEVPGNRKCTLTAVRPLAPELIAELDQK